MKMCVVIWWPISITLLWQSINHCVNMCIVYQWQCNVIQWVLCVGIVLVEARNDDEVKSLWPVFINQSDSRYSINVHCVVIYCYFGRMAKYRMTANPIICETQYWWEKPCGYPWCVSGIDWLTQSVTIEEKWRNLRNSIPVIPVNPMQWLMTSVVGWWENDQCVMLLLLFFTKAYAAWPK